MINNVVLVGRLTREVDLRYTQSGVAVANFTVAVDRSFRDANGERQTDFITCVMWRKAAENFAKYTRKGSLVGLEGSIQTRNYENQQGQRVYVTEVLVNNFTFLESKNVTENRPTGGDNNQYGGTYNNQSADPFGNYSNQPSNSSYNSNSNSEDNFGNFGNNNPFPANNNNNSSMEIADDDLPF